MQQKDRIKHKFNSMKNKVENREKKEIYYNFFSSRQGNYKRKHEP